MPTFAFHLIVPVAVSHRRYRDVSQLIEQLPGRDVTQSEGELLIANQHDLVPREHCWGGKILVLLGWMNHDFEVAYLKYVDSQWRLCWRRLGQGFPGATLVVRVEE